MVVSLSLRDQILGQRTLRQQGVGTYILTLYINDLQQRDSRLDLVRALDFFAIFYWQDADFFWV